MPLWLKQGAAPAADDARAEANLKRDQEYRRLLYVALTRAEDRLYVCGWHGRQAPPEGNWYQFIQAGLKASGGEIFPFDSAKWIKGDGWAGEGLRLVSRQRGKTEESVQARATSARGQGRASRLGEEAPEARAFAAQAAGAVAAIGRGTGGDLALERRAGRGFPQGLAGPPPAAKPARSGGRQARSGRAAFPGSAGFRPAQASSRNRSAPRRWRCWRIPVSRMCSRPNPRPRCRWWGWSRAAPCPGASTGWWLPTTRC